MLLEPKWPCKKDKKEEGWTHDITVTERIAIAVIPFLLVCLLLTKVLHVLPNNVGKGSNITKNWK